MLESQSQNEKINKNSFFSKTPQTACLESTKLYDDYKKIKMYNSIKIKQSNKIIKTTETPK